MKALLVEDDDHQRQALARFLRDRGYEVTEAPNGTNAWEQYCQKECHIVFLDWILPGSDGLEVCRRIKAHPGGRETLVLMITARNEPDDLQKILDAGADDYLAKPLDAELLHIRLAIAERRVQASRARYLAEQQLRESEKRYRLLSENASDFISRHAPDGTYLYVSLACRRLLGYEPHELIGRDPYTLFHPDDLANIRAKHQHLLHHEGDNTICYRLRRKDGTYVWFETNTRAVSDSMTGVVHEIICVSRDVSERRQAEECLRQTQKMEALGTLAGGIAHDFNNVLSAINGYVELTLEELPADSPARPNLTEVLRAGTRAKGLVQQILAFSHKTKPEPQVLALGPVIEETLRFLRASLPSTIEIRHVIPPPRVTVFSDPTAMHQLLMNLCTNAAHAMSPQGGTLTIGLQEIDLSPAQAAGRNLPPGPYVRLTVADTGCGMPPEVVGRIFEPFFTTKGVGEGTGMGLAVVHGVVRGCNGAIIVHSRVHYGTTFEILLPRVQATTVAAVATAATTSQAGKERILFVDDEPALLGLGKRMLEGLGYQVTLAHDGVEAWEIFQKQPLPFDVVVTDQTMPKLTGLELAQRVHELRPGFPVVLMTGYSDAELKEAVPERGIATVLLKPVSKRDLATALRQVLDTPLSSPSKLSAPPAMGETISPLATLTDHP